MNARAHTWIALGLGTLALAYVVGYVGLWQWTICRVEVPPGESLRLFYRGPFPFYNVPETAAGSLAKVEGGRPVEKGVLEVMLGPGRHFINPFEYKFERVKDIVIEPGMIGVVTAKVGKDLPAGVTLADEGYRGIRRRVLTPGRYRINPYAYDVNPVGVTACVGSSGGVKRASSKDATLIPPGYVGVVTNKVANGKQPQGIQPDVLQPGIYFINPYEKQVDLVSIGYNETTLIVELARNADGSIARRNRVGMPTDVDDDAPATDPVYVKGKGIEFPSNDGFPIHMDYTAIWGILPHQAPDVVRQFGELKGTGRGNVEQTVILPQIESVCRIHGSMRKAVQLLIGDDREAFQTDTAEELEQVLQGKNLVLLFGLTRHIYVPVEVREPIQKANIANELKLTRDQEQLTAKAQAEFIRAKEEVAAQEQLTAAETDNKVAQRKAEGDKQAGEIDAETLRLNAHIAAETAKIDAEIARIKGTAQAKKSEMLNQAKAERSKLYVKALGGPDAYNRYMFADRLPDDLRLGVFYAGPGTFWTDLKGFEQVLLGKLAADGTREKDVRPPAPTMPLPAADRR
ncbi:MAG TPA: SPFH domain-containing protein [Isosphaeraceae bacterium]|jgi:regulator of protease activity HflC (stomatin/prohibitin superfamily)|nr:SPFH domain-containing protein [Isosphaeraceae bacterium]